MRDISLDEPSNAKLPAWTFLIYGDTRSGKSYFAATFPRPYIYADIVESGYKTILSMDRSLWFEPDVRPIVRGIDQMNDIAADSSHLDALIAQKKVLTIVVDAFSFYVEFFLGHLMRLQTKPDNRSAYGDLGKHLREFRTIMHSKGVNVVWNCLAKHPDTDDPKGRPLIPGQQADRFSAGVDFLWYADLEQKRVDGKIVDETRMIRTRQHKAYIAGNRLGTDAQYLPDPLIGTYADFINSLGYDPEQARKNLPKMLAAAPKPTPIARPAVVIAKPNPVAPAKPNQISAPKVVSVPPVAKT